MSDFETGIREIYKAADAFCEGSTQELAGQLSLAVHKNMRALQGHDKLHESFMRTKEQLIRACWEWLEAAGEDRGFSTELSAEAHTAARDIRSLAGESASSSRV